MIVRLAKSSSKTDLLLRIATSLVVSLFFSFNSSAQDQITTQELAQKEEKLDKKIFLEEVTKAQELIEKDRDDISTLRSRIDLIIAERERVLQEAIKALPQIKNNQNLEETNLEKLKFSYNKVTLYWRILVDNSLEFFSTKSGLNFDFPQSIREKISIDEKFKDDSSAKKYLSNYKKLSEEYNSFLMSRNEFIELTKNHQSKILLQTGKTRSALLNKILNQDPNFIEYDEFYFDDLIRELKLIPYRPLMFFYSKLLDYKTLFKQGIKGIFSIIGQLFLLLFAIAIVVLGSALLQKVTALLSNFRENLIKSSYTNPKHRSFVLALSKIIPYFPWIFLIVIFESSYLLIEGTSLAEISIIFPYFIYYFCYKILRILIASILTNSFLSNNISFSYILETNKKARFTSKLLGLYILISLWILHFSETVVRKALLYGLINNLFFIGLIAIITYVTSLWAKELRKKSALLFSNNFHVKIEKLIGNKSPLFYSIPLLVLILIKTSWKKILLLLGDNDFVKTILAQIYRKKLESVAKRVEDDQNKEHELSQEYIRTFEESGQDNNAEFFQINTHPYEDIEKILNLWITKESQENSAVIYGERGIGKSSLLNYIENSFKEKLTDLTIVKVKISNKVITKKKLFSVIANNLEIEESKLESFIENHQQKLLIILDDCHNLFLSKKDGFEAFKAFADLVNSSSHNIFWLAGFSRYSWNYLYNALDTSNYFRYNFKLPRWSDTDIKNLILSKHEQSGLNLVYDSLIFTMQSQGSEKDIENVQQKFFQMLWSQSRGNPRTAIAMWLSSLRPISDLEIKISLPKNVKSSELINLSDDQLFIYAAIAKHSELSLHEIISVTNLQKGIVLNAVRVGLEKNYLSKSEVNDRYILSGTWQIAISKLLINKNFIYE